MGGGGEHIGVDDAGGPHPEVDPFEVGVGIRAGDAGYFLGDLGVLVPDSHGSSVGEGVDALRVDWEDFEAVGFEVEVLHNLALEEEGGVGVAGKAVAGEYLVGEGCAAEDVAAFQGEDSEAGLGQVGGGGEPVVARADDDYVIVGGWQGCAPGGLAWEW